MLELDKKLLDQFQGYVVRKDVVRSVKGGANVPVFVLEYLLANSCSTDDEQKIKEGVEILHNVAEYEDAIDMVTPYMHHYYIEALISCGAMDEALDVMRKYWGGMAKLGADTFWELYNPKNPDESPYGGTIVNSYCHAWSCAPAYFLRKYF